jgi:hypothetical protein
MSLPTPQLTLDFKTFFGTPAPDDRMSFLKGITKRALLAEISGLNYRLKPKDSIEYDISSDTQIRELKRFAFFPILRTKYFNIFKKYYDHTTGKSAIIFSRQTCLFALEEIAKSDLTESDNNFDMDRPEVWDSILKYLLCVNEYITRVTPIEGEITFEKLNPRLLPLNELNIAIDPMFLPYRGYELLKYFADHEKIGQDLKNYLSHMYDIEYGQFAFDVISMYMANKQDNPDLNFFYSVKPGSDSKIFNEFSKAYAGADTVKLIRSRKYPFVKISEEDYFLLDNIFLIEKIFSQFIHDFWFDWLKHINIDGANKYNISFYKSVYGYFTESYVLKLMQYMFKNKFNFKLLAFDELKVSNKGDEIEIADLYIRNDSKIFLGQVKSGTIYDNEKFGGDIEGLYKDGREKFFKNFGINQIVDSIKQINFIIPLDRGFPKGRKYEIYPCIVLSDKVFQTPLMADVFNTRFKELIADFTMKGVIIHSLSLLHISDLERMSVKVSKKPKRLWEFLEFNLRDKSFIPPFYNTLNRKIEGRQYPDSVLDTYKELIGKYSNSA